MSKTKTYSLMIHGGAGEMDHVRNKQDTLKWLENIRVILEHGRRILKHGGSALDAVEACATLLEDDPVFNAGRGSVLNEDGKVEMDAAIMDGRDLNAGAVTRITRLANPVQLARLVLTRSGHVMLAGDGALKFAKQHGIKTVPERYLITEQRLQEYKKLKKTRRIEEHRKHGTIGAVACDVKGNLAAATSTGGMAGKKYGRVGDTPIIGAGIYADNKVCAVSATGHGEKFMRTVLAKHIADLMEFKKLGANSAAKRGIDYLQRKVNGHGGVIMIDHHGACASAYNSRTMIRGWIENGGKTHLAF